MLVPSSPRVISAVTIEAFKKYIMVSLIEHGRLPSKSPLLLSAIGRSLSAHCSEYLDVAKTFETLLSASDVERTRKEISTHAELWRAVGALNVLCIWFTCFTLLWVQCYLQNGNDGLMNHVLTSIPRHHLQQLSSIYSTVSIETISKTLSPPSTSASVQQEITRLVKYR